MDEKQSTSLMKSIAFNDLQIFNKLILIKENLNIVDLNGDVALHYACEKYTKFDYVEMLIKNGADVNIANKIGETPLMVACHHQNLQMITLLLKNGAKVNAFDFKGQTALMLATLHGFWRFPVIKLLLKYGANINQTDHNGDCALHYALFCRIERAANILINEGCLVDIRNKFGFSPLVYGAMEGDIDNIILLVISGTKL